MIWIELERPAAEPVELAELKRFLRLERGDEDALLGTCLRAARETVEAETGLVLGERRVRLVFEAGAEAGAGAGAAFQALRRRPVRAVLAAVGYGADGAAVPLDVAAFALRDGRLGLPPGLAGRAPNGVEVEVLAGEAAADTADAVKLAVLRLAAVAYETRGAVDASMQPALLPPLVRALIAPFRAPRL